MAMLNNRGVYIYTYTIISYCGISYGISWICMNLIEFIRFSFLWSNIDFIWVWHGVWNTMGG